MSGIASFSRLDISEKAEQKQAGCLLYNGYG